jgi:hypothetical protein
VDGTESFLNNSELPTDQRTGSFRNGSGADARVLDGEPINSSGQNKGVDFIVPLQHKDDPSTKPSLRRPLPKQEVLSNEQQRELVIKKRQLQALIEKKKKAEEFHGRVEAIRKANNVLSTRLDKLENNYVAFSS